MELSIDLNWLRYEEPMEPLLNPQPSWIPRLQRLIRAKGWPQRDWRRHLGFGPAAVHRVLRGGRPKLLLLENLARLEGVHAREIEAFERGYVIVRGRRRYVWTDLSGPVRPPDIAKLG
jgi:hypothetical protein